VKLHFLLARERRQIVAADVRANERVEMADICEEKGRTPLTDFGMPSYSQREGTLGLAHGPVFSRKAHALSLAPLTGDALVHPLSGAEGHIAFAIAAVVAIIGICRMLLGLARDWREYRAGR
jgi:hypothetical protein